MKKWVLIVIAFVQFSFIIGQPKKNKNNSKKTKNQPVFIAPTVDAGEFDNQSPEYHKTPYEISNFTKTATYEEAVNWYNKLHRSFPNTELMNIGNSDAGLPIYCFHILPEIILMNAHDVFPSGGIYYGKTNPSKQNNPIKLLINNNIHPGEPEGTDASMLFARDFLTKQLRFGKDVYRNTDIYIVVQYNVDGTIKSWCNYFRQYIYGTPHFFNGIKASFLFVMRPQYTVGSPVFIGV